MIYSTTIVEGIKNYKKSCHEALNLYLDKSNWEDKINQFKFMNIIQELGNRIQKADQAVKDSMNK